MPAALTYPGVYIEELPSGVRTITGVATSITAFVGYTRRGDLDKPVDLYSFADFERSHGGLDRDSPLSYAVRQFFMNGGTHAIVVRVASGTKTTHWELSDSAGVVFDVTASTPGTWANDHVLTIDSAARNPDDEFNLVVNQQVGAALVPLETHRNLNMNPKSAQYAISVVNGASRLVRLALRGTPTFNQSGFAMTKAFPGAAAVGLATDRVIAGTIDGDTAFRLEIPAATALPDAPTLATALAAQVPASLTTRIAVKACAASGADSATGNFVKIESKAADASSDVTIAAGAFGGLGRTIGMGVANGGREIAGNAQHRPVAATKTPGPGAAALGNDGVKGGATELIGATASKTGMGALLDVDLFNILSIPETFDLPDVTAVPVIQAGQALCEKRRAFYIVDPPSTQTLTSIATWPSGQSIQHVNAATYFPAVQLADPLDGFRPRTMAASGTLAGLYARTDSDRGVWKAPAGTDGPLRGLAGLSLVMNDMENGSINPQGVNALRLFSTYGIVSWGARTMRGADALADEYKYIPVRRLALLLEETLYRATKWVVFELNDEPLWVQIRLNVGAFMQGLFRQGAFQGSSPREAYFVKCDRTTTTQTDINNGTVNIIVGFAPLKPAEFVVIKLQQMAGQIPT